MSQTTLTVAAEDLSATSPEPALVRVVESWAPAWITTWEEAARILRVTATPRPEFPVRLSRSGRIVEVDEVSDDEALRSE